MANKELTAEEQKLLLIIQEQIGQLFFKSTEGPITLDDCKKLQILHDSLNSIIGKDKDDDNKQTNLNISAEELAEYIDKINSLNPSTTPAIVLVKDDNDSGREESKE